MGDIRKQHKKFAKPLNLFDVNRIKEDNSIIRKYGLKNKREIWKADFSIAKLRGEAKEIIKNPSRQAEFLAKLRTMGFEVKTIDDVLGLHKEDWLERRLQTIVFKRGLAHTTHEARQLIVHRHIAVKGEVVSIPSFIVLKDLESHVSVRKK